MGYILGLVSAATYGLIPLFTLPLLNAGISVQTTLVYRFGIAALAMWPILLAKKEKVAINLRDLLKIGLLSLFYLCAVMLFFHAFGFLASGVVATLQFLYPVMVLLIMTIFFHEKFRWESLLAVILGIGGVALLSLEPGGSAPSQQPQNQAIFWGVLLSLLAGLCNAFYLVGIQVARIPHVNGLVMTFYVMTFGAIFCLLYACSSGSLEWLSAPDEIAIAILLALVTALISNLTLIMSIQRIGSTMTSILGVTEPLTAVTVGILVFGEPLTTPLLGGILLIAASVGVALLIPHTG